MKLAGNIARKNLISMGTCFGKFTGVQNFKLHITALDFISPYAKVKKYIIENSIEHGIAVINFSSGPRPVKID